MSSNTSIHNSNVAGLTNSDIDANTEQFHSDYRASARRSKQLIHIFIFVVHITLVFVFITFSVPLAVALVVDNQV